MTGTTITSESIKTKRPDATSQWQIDRAHEGPVFWALPYTVNVVGRRAEIMDRRYRRIAVLNLRRKPTDLQMIAISFNGEVGFVTAGQRRQVFLYNDGCLPKRYWAAYACRLEKLGRWSGGSASPEN